MERLDKRRIATHDGVVLSAANGRVEVQIASSSACASCEAHAKCGFAESRNKTLAIPTADWQRFAEGQHVVVNIDESRGMLAVWIAYVLPALIMLGAIVGLSLAGAAEWLVALAALAILALYVGGLYLLRTRIGKKFTLTVTPC